jgi:sulfatase maturation enzyme AslB (radical SAM superfamily)
MKTKKYDFLIHTTTICNYNCSYCNVKKWNQKLSDETISYLVEFLQSNYKYIETLKFFWWEPTLLFDKIKKIIDDTKIIQNLKLEIVTNASVLNDEIWNYLQKYFSTIFVSIDCENNFDFERFFTFVNKFSLKNKIIINLMFVPQKLEEAYKIFSNLYVKWYNNFNILPIYQTIIRDKKNLKLFSNLLKNIVDLSIEKKTLFLYGFQKNNGYNVSLTYESIFCNCDGKVYYTDFVSTTIWESVEKKLFLDNIEKLDLKNLEWLNEKKKYLLEFEDNLNNTLLWQKELHKIMDYFSKYLNKNVYKWSN